jgi:hypothetical protein
LVFTHLVLLVIFVAPISNSFSNPVPCMCVLYHKFYCIFFLLPPDELAWSQVIRSGVVQWLILALYKGPKWVGVFSPHVSTETDPVSETSYVLSLEYRTMEKSKNPVILCAIQDCQNPLESTSRLFVSKYYYSSLLQDYLPSQQCIQIHPNLSGSFISV